MNILFKHIKAIVLAIFGGLCGAILGLVATKQTTGELAFMTIMIYAVMVLGLLLIIDVYVNWRKRKK